MPEDDADRDAEDLRAQTAAYNEEADRLEDQLSEVLVSNFLVTRAF